jgi:hypothetical protein
MTSEGRVGPGRPRPETIVTPFDVHGRLVTLQALGAGKVNDTSRVTLRNFLPN